MAGYGFALLTAVLWGLVGPVAKLAFQEGVAPLDLALWRSALASVCFCTWAGTRGQLHVPTRLRRLGAYALLGMVWVALFFLSYHRAVATGGAAMATALAYTAPAQVAILSVLLFSASFTRWKIGAALLAVLGAGAVALGGAGLEAADGLSGVSSLWTGVLWGLVVSFCYTFYFLFGQRVFANASPLSVYAWAFPVGALCLLPLAGFPTIRLSFAGWGAVLWLSVVSTFLAHLAHGEALRRLDATRASIVTSLEPIVTGVVAYLWWNEQLGTIGWVGGALIVVAAVLALSERLLVRRC